MPAFLVAVALLGQAVPPAPPADDEIVVTGERPRDFRIVTRRDWFIGARRCALKPPSGDPVFDASICEAYLACVPNIRTAKELEACLTPPMRRAAEAWAERRKAAMATR